MSDAKRTLGHLSRQKLALLSEKLKERTVKTPRRKIDRRPNPAAPCQLSFAQQRLWFLDQLAPKNPFYNVPEALKLEGKLDLEVLERVFNEIVRRHEALRTRFEVVEGMPAQVVDGWESRRLEVEDLTAWTHEGREEEVGRIAREEAGTGFDLSRGPLLRVKALKLGDEEHVLLFTMHHIVSDGWSMEILVKEVGALYRAYLAGEPSPLEELPIQYADFAVWQRERLAGEALEREVGYWKERLRGAAVLELPADRPRPAAPSYRGGLERVEIGPEASEGLRRLSKQEGATLFMVMMAAFKLLLMRYSGEEDVVVGTVIANRTRKEVEGLIGFFVNTLVLRTDLGGNPSFRELIRREREVALEAYAHQEAPFEKLVEEINPDRDLSRSPLFQVMMSLQNADQAELDVRGLKLRKVGEDAGMAKFDLELMLTESGGVIAGSLRYTQDLYEAETIRRMTRHFAHVVAEVVRDAEQRVRELELMSAEEKEQVIVEFNRTERNYDTQLCIHELIEAQAEIKGEDIAVVCEEERASYGELNRRANQVAGCLIRRGVGCEDRVGICVERGIDMVVGIVGILKAGAAYVPLDPSYPRERLEYMLEDASVKALLTQERLKEIFGAQGSEAICLDSDWPRIAREEGENPGRKAGPENLAYVIYTSGSTGKPKGVAITHRSAVTLLKWSVEEFSDREMEGVLASTSICFDLSVFELMVPLSRGGKVVVAENALSLPELMAAGEVRLVNTVPSAMRELVGRQGIPESVETVNLAGEALRNDLAQQIYERGEVRRVVNLYGPTEDTTYTTWGDVVRGAEEEPTLGRPISNTEVYILDQELCATPIGIYGEIYISGEGLARCYLDRPETTAERFLPNRFGRKDGGRLYRTGDIGRYGIDGSIEYQGRADHQVKVRGYRIELGEIERALEEKEWVREAVVVVREENPGDKRIVAYVVTEEGREGEAAGLRKYLKEKLPEYMTPSAIVALEKMPLTPNGKLDRKALPGSGHKLVDTETAIEAARTPIEEMLVGIFGEVLRRDGIGVRNNFFELGGHSLLATRVISRVRNTFEVEIGVKSIFEEPTAEGLAQKIEKMIGAGEKQEAPPLVRVEREGQKGARLPLSFAQQRLWFLDQLMPNNPFYNIPCAVRLEGRLDFEALERVVNEIVRRHEALRTRIEVEENLPAQVIDEWEPQRLELNDLTSLSWEEREKEARRIMTEEAVTGFDLSRGPLLRVKVLKLDEEQHVLLYTMHHIVSDGWSIGILIKEVGALYRAYSAGLEAPLEELPIQYADFAAWQRAWLQGETLERELEYWRRRLAGARDLELPTDHPRPAARSHRGAIRYFAVERELSERLRELSRREGVTLFMTLLGGFDLLMSRYSGQRDVVVGTDIANRNRAEIEGLIGFFVNQLVMRVEVRPEESFRELLRRVREVCLGAYAHQDVPFEKLVEELQPERDLSRSPLFQVKLILQNAPGGDLELGGLKVMGGDDGMLTAGEERTAKFDLSAVITDVEHGLVGAVEYSQDLFEEETVERLTNHYTNLLRTIVEGDKPVSELSLLSDREKAQIVVEWNETGKPYPIDRRIHEMFAEQAARTPDQIALIGDGRQLSYGELNRRANQLGRYMQRLGVGPDAPVGLCLERSVETVVAILGTLKAGGAYLPLDPEYPLERLSYMLEDAGVRVVLTQQELEERLPAYWGHTVCLDKEWEKIGAESIEEVDSNVDATNLAYVIYTSGSTGKPKGVAIPHRAVLRLTLNTNYAQLDRNSCLLQLAPQTFDAATFEMWGALLNGGRLVMAEVRVPSVVELGQMISKYGVDTMWLTASLYNAVVDGGVEELRGLKQLLTGGEALSVTHMRVGIERLEGTKLINGYGPTEGTTFTCCHWIRAEDVAERKRSVPIGRPIANTRVYVMDEWMGLAPVGVVGELYIGGDGLARCYLDWPDMTAEKFIPHPYSKAVGERLYRTGDSVRYLSDGKIEFVGRADEQVKIRGHRIELGEIEATLNDHPSVRRSVVIVNEDERGDKRLLGYVTGEATAAELKRYVRERLPEYMVPDSILALEEMPVTANGKIDRKRLPLVEGAGRQREQEYVVARTPVEEMLSGIFEEALRLDRVGRADNFFELGGHSLLATQAVSRIRDVFAVEIGVGSVFEEPTVEGLAQRIEEAIRAGKKDDAPPLVRAPREGEAPLSFAQQRLWFLDQLVPNNPFYNIPGAVRLVGSLDLEVLGRVVDEVFRRHEVLRTRIDVREGGPAQVIDEWEPRELDVKDLTRLAQEEKEDEVRSMAREEAATGFDLSRGPLLRVKALKLGDEEHVLLFTMHHIVSDGWSMEILIREVGTLYRAYLAGDPSPLEELPIQYADFAVWQRAWLQGEPLERELEYWRRQLDGMEALELPIDYPRPPAPSNRGARRHFVVERELTQRLRELGQREGVTLFMTLLGGFDVLMSRYSGQRDVVVGTDIANRNRAETEGLIGFFVNQLVMRVEVRPEESFRELLRRVREVCLGAYAHQDVPFEKLVEELQPERDLSRSPLFQVKLLLQDAPREGLELGGVRLTSIGDGEMQMASEEQTAKFDLTVAVINEESGPVGIVEYNRDLFKDGTIERLMSHYVNVLKGIVEDGWRPVSELNFLSAEEREQILVEWNETARPYPGDQCIHELFDQQAKRTPEQIALIGDEQWLSYGDLNRRANLLGHYLRGLGVGPEVVVGLCLEQSLELVTAMIGVLKAGGAYLPLDPEYPLERLSFMLEDAEVGIVVTERELEERLPLFWGQTVCLNEEWRRISEGSESEPESEVGAQNLVYVIYTSGSTGEPKGIAVHQQALVARTMGLIENYELTSDDSVLQFVSPSFDAFGDGLFTTLSCGASLVIDPLAANYSTHHLFDKVERLDITSLHIPPAYWHQLVDELFSSQRHISSRLRILATGGESPSVEKVRKWAALASDQSRYINAYGPTEATITSTVYGTQVGSSQINLQTRAPIGRPLANTQVYVLGLNQEVAPIGVKGELYIGGAGVARGYLGRAEMIAGKFVPHPFSEEAGARLYRTGDVGRYLENGDIELLGRVDEQVKVRGYRIELGEIEAALDEHQSVRQSAVVVSDDDKEDRRLLGYVVAEEGVTGTSLKKYLREKLPEYMIPEAILVLEEMPVTANGKIDRKRLPSLKDAGSQLKQEYVGARTPAEEMLVGIFEEALKIHQVGQVGIHDNFFEIGGHSLLATQVVSRVRNTFGVEIGVKGVFEVATVEGLARRIEEAMRAGEKTEAPPLIKVPRDGQKSVRAPLSFAQQRLWFLDQLVPNNPFYNIPGAITLEGRLNLKALESVINEIIRRHEVLRTRIEIEKGMPAQVIDGWEPRRLQVDDLSGRTREEQEEEVSRIAREEAGTGFDLSRGPLLRVKALKLGDEEHVLLFTMHHIVSDGWSMGILIREVGALYRAYLAGEPSPLEELPIQYADFAVWQRAWLQGEPLERELEYWRRQLAGMKSLDLPTDHPRPAALSYQGAGRHFVVERELTQRLRELGQREGVTLFMTLLGGFDVLMSRYSGQQEVVVGTDIANRNRAETEGLIGFFVNQLVMRVEVRPEESFRELLRRVREVCLGAYAHQDVPFEKLVEELQPERDLSRSPLFQVKLLLQDAPREELELGGLRLMKDGDGEAQTSRFDLTVAITDAGDDLIGMVEYSSDLFKEGTIERLTGHYVNALKWIAEDVERPISELSLLSEEELEQILVEWNETARPYPNDRCVHELFDEQVENAPEAVALIYQDQRLTYAELDARSSQLARYLRRFGVGPETLVGVCVDRSLEMVVGLLGILKAGGAYVPIDPAYPVERMAFMLDDARVKALLTQDQLLDLLPTNSVQVINLDAEWRVIAAESKERLSSGATAENLAYVIYTSGSTGRPKGVLVPHNQVANFFAAMDANIEHGPDAIWLAVTSISFDISVLELLWTLARGFQVVVHGDVRSGQPADGPQADITENDGRAIYDEDLSVPAQIVRGQVSHLQCTPSMAKMLSLGSDSNGPFSSLRQLLIGGEAFPIELAYDLKPLAPGEIRNMYGPTETTIWSTTYSLRGEERGIPIGRPIANTQTYILDRELGVAPIGVPGELYIGGKGVVRGYLNRSELTAERFLPDSFSREPGARVYRTGDLTRYSADGEIEFLGRIDHQVKIRGYRIELGEIEARLNSHPAVRQCAVIAHNYGKSEKRLAAYMVGEGEGASHASELRAYLKETLPEYMLPARFVWLDQMPLTPNGKVDRRALPAPDVNRSGMTEGYVGPRTPVEQTLARIFQEALRLDQVGIHSSFFELGGDSILGIQIISRANAAGLGLTPRQLFQHQSVAELAAVADVARPSESGEPDVVGEIPLTPVQERFFEEYDRELGSFNQAMILEAREELDIEALRKVVERLLKQHSVLRHRFKKGENGWVQVCEEPDGAAPLEEVSLSTINGGPAVGSIEAAAEKYLKEMNIDQGPLMRVVVFDGGKGGRRHVLIVAHHLVIDEASWRVLSEDLERWYGQARRGEEINPGAKTTSYKRWAESLKEEAQSERSREEAKYWLAQAGMRVRRLPVDKRGANTVASGRIVAASLSVKETAALLKEVVASRKTQIDEILLSAVARAVGEWSGDQIVTVEVEGRGREETIKGLDLTRAVGCFTSRYPLRVELEDGNGAELLRNVKEQMREARRRGVYYGMLKYLSEEPDIREKLRALPEAEISFNYLGEQDSVLREGALFRPANGRILETRSRAGNRRHLIEVNVSIRRGRLQLVWTYSRNVHRRETIATMAESARKALRSLVSEGPSSPEQSYTPSDFPLIDIDQQRLDRILSKRAKMKDDH